MIESLTPTHRRAFLALFAGPRSPAYQFHWGSVPKFGKTECEPSDWENWLNECQKLGLLTWRKQQAFTNDGSYLAYVYWEVTPLGQEERDRWWSSLS